MISSIYLLNKSINYELIKGFIDQLWKSLFRCMDALEDGALLSLEAEFLNYTV